MPRDLSSPITVTIVRPLESVKSRVTRILRAHQAAPSRILLAARAFVRCELNQPDSGGLPRAPLLDTAIFILNTHRCLVDCLVTRFSFLQTIHAEAPRNLWSNPEILPGPEDPVVIHNFCYPVHVDYSRFPWVDGLQVIYGQGDIGCATRDILVLACMMKDVPAVTTNIEVLACGRGQVQADWPQID
jgi:hypothetical protein